MFVCISFSSVPLRIQWETMEKDSDENIEFEQMLKKVFV